MKVTKISTQSVFQPIEIKITIESQEDYDSMKYLYMNSSNIYDAAGDAIRGVDSDALFVLETLLDNIGECL